MSYHVNLQKRIHNDELIGFELIENYQGKAKRLLLYFQSEPKIRPVLMNKIEEYKDILKDINTKFEQFTQRISPIEF